MMSVAPYDERRGRLQTYFDKTAVTAWAHLTSDVKVSGIRQTVREGRDRMRAVFMGWLPTDMDGATLLDAGCGTGALSVAVARRGARIVAVDVAGNLVQIARERAPADLCPGRIDFRVGDMLSADHGRFTDVVAMDSLIHYPMREILDVIAGLAGRTTRSINFTFAPATPLLSAMHAVGLLFPRSNRAPAIIPVSQSRLTQAIAADPRLAAWRVGRTARIINGFYTSQAMELVRR
ncbi:magnesium protoporphyrin IX methyltransferase [Phenylobacterium sp.]|uniref:magnesium protoporphyrin IX methyltransferase n=1 Tax=Phenylobacterium sp. TaxID=1871053 RepID=UPI0025FB03FE|nr:magnesium protoporphyrin IX methyltransferase [Phenylobacterium sp.]